MPNTDRLAGIRSTWIFVPKLTDQARSSTTTLANDAELLFTMAANTRYAIRGKVCYGTPAAADLKWRHTGPASPTGVQLTRRSVAPGASALGNVAHDSTYSASDIVITETSGTEGAFEFEGIIVNGSTEGDFAIQWAQNTSNASPTTVYGGSYIEYRVIG